jgi:hypothetical protein
MTDSAPDFRLMVQARRAANAYEAARRRNRNMRHNAFLRRKADVRRQRAVSDSTSQSLQESHSDATS